MPDDRRVLRADEESRFFTLLNALDELGRAFEALDVPAGTRGLLAELKARCRADFDTRFR